MKKIVLTFGLLSGLVLSGMLVLTVPFAERIGFEAAEVIGYTTIVAASLFIHFGIRRYRDSVAGGEVSFGRAFKVGALIALISSACHTATWQVVYHNYMPDFLERYQANELEKARQAGATPAEIDAQIAKDARNAALYRNPLINIGITLLETFPIGLVIAAISARFASRRRQPEGGGVTAVA